MQLGLDYLCKKLVEHFVILVLKKLIPFLFILGLIACSPYSNSPVNNGFHNLTAHYNAYFIAHEKIKEIEQAIYDQQDWNYNKTLPIYPQFDSTTSASLKTLLEEVVQKGSIAIQRHPGSKWEDDSYLLVGKARYYASEFPDAIETFKYVNTHSDDDETRFEALSELIRTYTEYNELRNAEAVVDYLAREELTRKNQKSYFLNAAYLFQKKNDLKKMSNYLGKASELITDDKARLYFVLGQTYHDLDNDSLAYLYYDKVLKNKPTYELEFYAKLYMNQVTELADLKDLKKARKYFEGLIRDPKNKEYQDKIYYELALFELKNGNLDEAILNYKNSIKSSESNPRQKGLSYLGLGELYYDSINNYQLAKSYYDSTVNVLPKDEDNYETIKKRQEILSEFVQHILIVQKNDSLLALSELPEDSLMGLAIAKLELQREVDRKKKEKDKQAARNRARNLDKTNEKEELIAVDADSEWYFSNTTAVSRGANDFIKKWGDRKLEDNWRRSSKTSSTEESSEPIQTDISESTGQEELPDINEEARTIISSVPKSPEEKTKLLAEIELALYHLGKIYYLKLDEKGNAIFRFEELLNRFPKSEHEPEVLYQLFLLHKKTNRSEFFGQKLKEQYPESIYAKLVDNPLYREEDFAANEQLKKIYRTLYKRYNEGDFTSVKVSIDSLLAIYPGYDFSDNVALLKVLCTGKTEKEYQYQYELGKFIEDYPESELNEFAKELLLAVEEFQKERYNSAKARFIKDFNQKHYFVILHEITANLSDTIAARMKNFLQSQNLNSLQSGNLILNETSTMFLVNWFPGKGTALKFLELYKKENVLSTLNPETIKVFLITKDNFDILYKTKDPEAYLKFYNSNY